MIVRSEPAAKVSGLFPPDKFGDTSDEQLIELVAELAARLACAAKQTSVHAQVCGRHCAWKRAGATTSTEATRGNCDGAGT